MHVYFHASAIGLHQSVLFYVSYVACVGLRNLVDVILQGIQAVSKQSKVMVHAPYFSRVQAPNLNQGYCMYVRKQCIHGMICK